MKNCSCVRMVGLVLVVAARAGTAVEGTATAPAREPAAEIEVDGSQMPEMADWATRVKKVAVEEYPKIAAMLPSEGFAAPRKVRILIDKDMTGVAATSGETVHLAAKYFQAHPDDVGAVVHELAHVVQHYQGRRGNPGWLVEGIADWVRFYHYEPQENRPVINPKTTDYRKGYREAAAFLAWMDGKYGPGVVVKINAAMRDGKYQEGIFEELTKKPMGGLWEEYVSSVTKTSAEARLLKDIEYGTAPTPVPNATPPGTSPAATRPAVQKMESLRLDACVPAGGGGEEPLPVVILIHGGGWSGGDKAKDITPVFEPLTNAGFVWFSINYRLSPANRWPSCLEDVQTAIRWVKAHAGEYRGDPKRIALLGHSAGGHLAFLAAVLAKQDTRVQAAVGLAPVTDHEQDLPVRQGLSASLQALLDRPKELTPESLAILRDISPINHLPQAERQPPFLIIQGDADRTVPLQQSKSFQAKVKESGGSCDLVTVPGAPHAVLEWDKFDSSYKGKLTEWLARQLKNLNTK